MLFNAGSNMKTADLQGAALDWAVAKAEGAKITAEGVSPDDFWLEFDEAPSTFLHSYQPSADWSQGGPLFEREHIELRHNSSEYEHVWYASKWLPVPPPYNTKQQRPTMQGDTALIAAMRCYVASKLGDEIDIPKELL